MPISIHIINISERFKPVDLSLNLINCKSYVAAVQTRLANSSAENGIVAERQFLPVGMLSRFRYTRARVSLYLLLKVKDTN